MHVADPRQLLEAHLRIPDVCAASAIEAVRRSGHELADVDFFCVYQGTSWIQRVVLEHLGVRTANVANAFGRFAYLSSAMIPATLAIAEQDGLLARGDLVVAVGGGTGMTYGATVLRWGST